MKILLVEDDTVCRKNLSRPLVAANHDVVEARNGHEALALLRSQTIPFVITDWQMPGLDGLDLCRQIRKARFHNYIYIIVITAKEDSKDRVEALQAGADDYICKPVRTDELMARVETGVRLITLEKKYMVIQKQLISSRNKLQTIFDTIQEEIVTIDQDSKITSLNRSCSKWLGVDSAKPLGEDFRCIFDPILVDAVRLAFEEKEKQDLMMSVSGKGGSTSDRQVTILPIHDDNRKVFLVIVVMKDLTEERRHAEEVRALNELLMKSASQLEVKNRKLENTLEKLEEAQSQMVQSEKMASIGQLAAGVAHEINNPTGFVSSNLKTLGDYKTDIEGLILKYHTLRNHLLSTGEASLRREGLDALINDILSYEKEIDVDFVLSDTDALIEDCREGTERIKKIVSDLKDFAHPGDDHLQLVDINAGLTSTLNVVNNEIKYKAEVRLFLGDIPAVFGCPQQLNQVFMNILVNAAQAIESEGTISITTRVIDSVVEVEISDTGCGIPAENLTKIFDPFFTTKDVGKGTGLGMHIVYNIVMKHQGAIDVESKPGQGTTFTVRIPIEPPSVNSIQVKNGQASDPVAITVGP